MEENQKFNFQDTQATRKIFDLTKRIRAVCGGTSASKTISILVWLIDYAQSRKNKKIDIMSESYPHLKDGAMRDFKAIMIDRGYWKDSQWNETDHVYTFSTASIIKFISIDKPGKAHGPRRDVLFVNEANNIPFAIYEQLEVRTKEVIWLDWNPSEEFWYYDKIKNTVDHDFLTLTYLDCLDVLDPRIVQSIESKKNNKNWWLVYGLGQLGEVEGRIYTGWQIMDEIPFEARLERYGLDFGYTNDPTAIVGVYKYNGGFIVDEITYQKGLSNKQIADILGNIPKALVIADSAEPKSIDEIASYGINILPSQKGQGSVLQGIQYVQDQKISVTQRSVNLLKEYRNYMWQTDKDGKIINTPEAGWDHMCFASGTIVNGKKIEDVGYMTGVKDVYEYIIAGEKITSTKNHKIITHRGIVDIDALRYNDVIWKKKSLFMRVSGGLDIQTVRDGLFGVTIVAARRIVEAKGRDYTDSSGKKKTDLSPTDSIFITLMATPSIIRLITLSLLTAIHTLFLIGLLKSVHYGEKKLKRLSRRPQNGLKPQKDKRGENKWDTTTSILRWIEKQLREIVTCAEKNTLRKETDKIVSATSTAVKKRYVGRELVYNLKTKSGMYHANGILVSNCDALRYALESLKPTDNYEELPDDTSLFTSGFY